MKELQAIVTALLDPANLPGVLATLVAVDGSSYRRPGARLLMTSNGRRLGSISGGCLEEDVLTRAARVREDGLAAAVVYDTSSENDLVWGVGLGCHGVVRVLLEPVVSPPEWARQVARNLTAGQISHLEVRHAGGEATAWRTGLANATPTGPQAEVFWQLITPPPALVIFGAGDDAMPVARLAKDLGWRVTVADPRPAAPTGDRFPMVDARVVAPADSLVAATAVQPGSLAVVMTHRYVHDRPILRDLLGLPLSYVGLLGPKKRATKILADLETSAPPISAAQKSRLYAPVGLDLGGDSPEQVALSIIAEMQAVLSARDGRPLRERTRPIHE